MLNDFGYAGSDWEEAKAQATEVLIGVARRKGRIAYSELAEKITAIKIEAHDPRMFHMLGEISTSEHKAGRGMLTAIVVHKSGDMQPGPGIFDLAKFLGKDTSDILKCWVAEFNKVHDYWANKSDMT